MENLTQRWTQSGLFFKIRAFFFTFKKRQGEACPCLLPSCTSVSLDEYASISLNIPKYPGKCLHNVLTMPGL